MSELNLHIKKAGLLSSFQDQGRLGMQNHGVPMGGALDRKAAEQANLILGCNPEKAVLEVTLLGPEIYFSAAVDIAITGAEFPLKLNGESVASYKKLSIPADSILKFGHATKGCRAYMAISADWQIPRWQGSVSPLMTGSGLLTANILKNGQEIRLLQTSAQNIEPEEAFHPANLSPIKRIRVSLGPEFEELAPSTVAQLFGKGHLISQDASRMGYRLKTTISQEAETAEMISSGILPGTIQLTSGGQPIILLADAQTTGGYPRIARVIDEDLDAIAQLKPGDEVWFSLG